MDDVGDFSRSPYDLGRFVEAQERIYPQALQEIRSGQKQSHWMWFIFPQIEGLGFSPASRRYSIKNAEEARAYLDHPVLGARLVECFEALVALQGRSAVSVFGPVDEMKLRSSATLFAQVSAPGSVFEQALEKYFGGEKDELTLRILADTGRRSWFRRR
jgi:uncharacterized protein (DUF1810 family)